MEPECQSLLSFLPRKPVLQFKKGQTIYSLPHGSTHLYVLILGLVKLSNQGFRLVSDLVSAERIFGHSCLVLGLQRDETAVALENVALMAWSREEIEEEVLRQPRLGIVLYHSMLRKHMEFQQRLETVALLKTPERVLLSLVHLANRFRVEADSDGIRVLRLTHELVSAYSGITREGVTAQMNHLRRQGIVQYSRSRIELHMPTIERELRRQGLSLPQSEPMPSEALFQSA